MTSGCILQFICSLRVTRTQSKPCAHLLIRHLDVEDIYFSPDREVQVSPDNEDSAKRVHLGHEHIQRLNVAKKQRETECMAKLAHAKVHHPLGD